MRKLSQVSMMAIGLLFGIALQTQAQDGRIEETFRNVREIRIKTVSGDCIVERGRDREVKVQLVYTYDDYDFEPELVQRGDRLTLTERFTGRGNVRGHSEWRLIVPEKTDVDFSTASGDLEVSDLSSFIEASTASGDVTLKTMDGEFKISTASGEIEGRELTGDIRFGTASGDVFLSKSSGKINVSTASGRIRAKDLEGELELRTASGDIDLSSANGEFKVSAASGDVVAKAIVLEGKSSFSAASGNVELSLGESPVHNLKVSSASGDAILDFNGNKIKGFIEMTAKAGRRGRIRAPFDFDDEEYYYKWDDEYVTKTVTMGRDRPRIEVSTASGKAVLAR